MFHILKKEGTKNTFILIESMASIGSFETVTYLRDNKLEKCLALGKALFESKPQKIYSFYPYVTGIRNIKFSTGYYVRNDLMYLKLQMMSRCKGLL